MKALAISPSATISNPADLSFREIVKRVERTVSRASFRVYNQTYRKWERWAIDNGIEALHLSYDNIAAFLESQDATKATLQRQLSSIRTLLKFLSVFDTDNGLWRRAYEASQFLKISRDESKGHERERRALSPKQVFEVMNASTGDNLIDYRNRALLAVMFYVGARRSEIVALKWADVDLENRIINIRHGKGDKERQATIIGEAAIEALQVWKHAQFKVAGEMSYVFGAIGKGDKIAADKPMTTNGMWKIAREIGAKAGVEFSPHDARRTLATDLLMNNSPLADVKEQLGHAREATTLRYARPADAKARRGRLKMGY